MSCALHQVNPRDFVECLSDHERLELQVITDSVNYETLPSISQNQIHHCQPSARRTELIFSRLNPLDKRRFKNVLQDVDPDILLSLSSSELVCMSSISNFSPSVLLPQGGETAKALNSTRHKVFFRPVFWELLRHVDEAWTSPPNKSLLSKLGLPEERFRNFDWGVVDTDKFYRRDENSVKYVDDPNTTVIGTFRRQHFAPNLKPSYETFLDSIGELKKQYDDFHLVIGGYYEDDIGIPIRDMIEKKIDEYNLESSVTKVDMVPKEKMPEFYSGLDIYINPTYSGMPSGIGTGSKEAMACQCAYVTFDNSSPEYIINHRENGLILPIGEPKKLSDELYYLCENKEYRQEIARAGRKTIVENFSENAIRSRVFNICNNIVNEYQ